MTKSLPFPAMSRPVSNITPPAVTSLPVLTSLLVPADVTSGPRQQPRKLAAHTVEREPDYVEDVTTHALSQHCAPCLQCICPGLVPGGRLRRVGVMAEVKGHGLGHPAWPGIVDRGHGVVGRVRVSQLWSWGHGQDQIKGQDWGQRSWAWLGWILVRGYGCGHGFGHGRGQGRGRGSHGFAGLHVLAHEVI